MAATVVMAMVPADVTGEPPLHHRTERCRRLVLQHGVEVIGHHTKAEQSHRKLVCGDGEQVAERAVVGVFVEERRATIPAIEDMIGEAGQLPAGDARPGGDRTSRDEDRARKSSLSPFAFLEKAWFPRLDGNPPAGTGSFYAQKAEQMEINSPIDF
jgi:hypothetical protein